MSMCLGLCTLADEDVAKVLAHPPLVWKVIAPDDPEAYQRAVQPAPTLLDRLLPWRRRPVPPAAPPLSAAGSAHEDLDKAWHGLHFLLTGTAWAGEGPLAFLLLGGASVGDLDVGYGPARALTAAEVREVAGALAPLDEAWLRGRFDPKAMMAADVYPTIWDRDPAEDDTFGYLLEYFGTLRRFVERAAAQRMGLVLYLG